MKQELPGDRLYVSVVDLRWGDLVRGLVYLWPSVENRLYAK
jgi:hypothetical protein